MSKLADWVQIVSSIVLVAGLALVVSEMRQSKQLAQAQLASDSYNLAVERHLAAMGEDLAKAHTRACDNIESISREDSFVLLHWYLNLVRITTRAREIDQIGSFDNERWQGVARNNLRAILSGPGGRRFLEAHPISRDPEYKEIIDSIDTKECQILLQDAIQGLGT